MDDNVEQKKPEATIADVYDWFALNKQLSDIKAREIALRTRIFAHFFTEPKEGTNTYPLGESAGKKFAMKGKHNINRKVMPDDLAVLQASLSAEGSNLPKLPMDKLIKFTPELVKSEYNKLSPEDRKVFDACLEIKDGTPALEVVEVKR